MSADASSPTSSGNEVFFSFLAALEQECDRGNLPETALRSALKAWGLDVGRRASMPGEPGPALDRVAEVLPALGLVRVFEPVARAGEPGQALVLRCLLARNVTVPRVRKGLPYRCPLAPVVEGLLAAGGLSLEARGERAGMLRGDECTLSLSPAEKG